MIPLIRYAPATPPCQHQATRQPKVLITDGLSSASNPPLRFGHDHHCKDSHCQHDKHHHTENILSRALNAVTTWLREFFKGIWADLTGKNKPHNHDHGKGCHEAH